MRADKIEGHDRFLHMRRCFECGAWCDAADEHECPAYADDDDRGVEDEPKTGRGYE